MAYEKILNNIGVLKKNCSVCKWLSNEKTMGKGCVCTPVSRGGEGGGRGALTAAEGLACKRSTALVQLKLGLSPEP